MSRKVVRLTLDHLDELDGARAAPACSGSSTRYAAARVGRSPCRREGGLDLGGPARVGLVRAGGARRRPAGRATRSTRRAAFVAGRGRLPHRAGVTGRRAADDGVRRTRRTRRRARADAGAGHGPRPDRARRDRAPSRRSVTPAAGRRAAALLPVDFLAQRGLQDPPRRTRTTPRMRMDLRTALTWKDEVEAALEKLLGAVRPKPATEARRRTATRAAARLELELSGRWASGDELGELVEQRGLGAGADDASSRPRRPGRR